MTLEATDEQKALLRKVRGVPGAIQDIARNTLNRGTIDQDAYIQFGVDLGTYNLWEALLYAKGNEDRGMFKPGSAQKALNAVIKKLPDGPPCPKCGERTKSKPFVAGKYCSRCKTFVYRF